MARILVVDDDQLTRVMLATALEQARHEVRFAIDGETAVAAVYREPFDLVVMDLAMPKMNGHLAIRTLVADYPSLPILAISGEDADQLDRALEEGARAAMVKPLEPQLVQERVAELLDDEGAWDAAHLI